MNKTEIARQLMINEVLSMAEKHSAVWNDNPEFTGLFNTLTAMYKEVQEYFMEKELLQKPYGKIKEEAWDEFAVHCTQLSAFLMQIAIKKEHPEQQKFFRYTVASFKRGAIQEVLTRAENILAYAEQNLDELLAMAEGKELYETTVTQLTSFKRDGLLPTERRKRLKNITQWIHEKHGIILEFLKNQMDPYMVFFLHKSDEFYDEYQSARKVRSLRRRSEGTEDDLSSTPPEGPHPDDLLTFDELEEIQSARDPHEEESPPASTDDDESLDTDVA